MKSLLHWHTIYKISKHCCNWIFSNILFFKFSVRNVTRKTSKNLPKFFFSYYLTTVLIKQTYGNRWAPNRLQRNHFRTFVFTKISALCLGLNKVATCDYWTCPLHKRLWSVFKKHNFSALASFTILTPTKNSKDGIEIMKILK